MRVPRLLVSLLLAGALVASGCGSEEEADPATASPPAAAQSEFAPEAKEAVRAVEERDAFLLDVRTGDEVAEGRAAGSTHLPLPEIEAGERPDVDQDRPIYVYCRTGRRAAVAAKILRDDGFTNVTNIGGLSDWEAAGGAVER